MPLKMTSSQPRAGETNATDFNDADQKIGSWPVYEKSERREVVYNADGVDFKIYIGGRAELNALCPVFGMKLQRLPFYFNIILRHLS